MESVKVAVSLQITTGYNLEDDRCECVALQDYKENEQVIASLSLVFRHEHFSPILIIF